MFVSSGNLIPQKNKVKKKKKHILRRESDTQLACWWNARRGCEQFGLWYCGCESSLKVEIVGWDMWLELGERERVREWLVMGVSSLRTRRQWRLWRRRRSLRGVGFCLTPLGKARCSTWTNMPSCIGFRFMRVISESLIPCSLTPLPFLVVRRPLFLTWRSGPSSSSYIYFLLSQFVFWFCFLILFCFFWFCVFQHIKAIITAEEVSWSPFFILQYVMCDCLHLRRSGIWNIIMASCFWERTWIRTLWN